jgi:hypothetical protein
MRDDRCDKTKNVKLARKLLNSLGKKEKDQKLLQANLFAVVFGVAP